MRAYVYVNIIYIYIFSVQKYLSYYFIIMSEEEKNEKNQNEPIEPERLNTPDWRNPDDVKSYFRHFIC
jgi:hypothetical protein